MTTGAPQPTTAPRRSRARTFVPLAIAAWLVLEIWLLTVVAGATSGFVVLLLIVAGGLLGATVIKRAGRRAFKSLTETLQQQSAPGAGDRPSGGADGSGNGFLMLAGLLLMLPGLVSDALGLVLLVPPVRTALAKYTERTLERKMSAMAPGGLGDAFQQARIHRPDGKVVQGEVIREDGGPAGPTRHDNGPRPPLTP
ncbi:FxsA family membrane protein [Streptomyces sp. NPDC050504]|uniref:FxsA family membrane protein n=1 Tax=Streptomyces sp. NPDC050504 TaxID=3365618 RepID=UPI00379AC670